MIPESFDYHAPTTIDEALALLAEHGDDAKILAGGQSLIPAMRFRLAVPEVLIDINRLDDLRYIEERDEYLAIGAMTRESAVEASKLVRESYPLLLETARVIADPLVRNQATIGGNLAHADPANDHPATMLAYDATIVAQGPGGTREIAVDDFFTGLFETALADGELLTEIRIPKPRANGGGAYLKFERKVGDYAISAVAVNLTMNGDTVERIRIGLTNLSAVPMRARQAEAALLGHVANEETLEEAGKAAAAECDPSGDLRGSAEYKRDVTRVLVKRTVMKAISRVHGGTP